MISLSDMLRNIALAAGRSIIFLGTGPSDPITDRGDKSNRKNTHSLINYNRKRYLIDIPDSFDKSIKFDFLINTHFHSDAFGGIDKIKSREFTYAIPGKLADDLKEKGSWKIQRLSVNKKNKVGDMDVIPFEVIHDVIYDYPTYGYQMIFGDGYKLTYASDMKGIPKKSEQYFNDIDMLVADGAGWDKNLATHYGIKPFINKIEREGWKADRVYFTQIGRSVPDYDDAKLPGGFFLTYDGMGVNF